MLRKFHSTTLWNEKVSKELVDALQGRGQDQTHASYFYENPLKLREIYIENMHHLCINWDVTNIDLKSPEYMQLEQKYNEKEAEVKDMEDRLSFIEKTLFDIDNKEYSRDEILSKVSKKKLQ